jgi:hypothetical protein
MHHPALLKKKENGLSVREHPIHCYPHFQAFLKSNYQYEKNVMGCRIYRRKKMQTSADVNTET